MEVSEPSAVVHARNGGELMPCVGLIVAVRCAEAVDAAGVQLQRAEGSRACAHHGPKCSAHIESLILMEPVPQNSWQVGKGTTDALPRVNGEGAFLRQEK